ncbi:hypothetical protein IJS18_00585 [Candidatus Saccharibacteria bacterium]|nr:hypothetical protein [Candidatus Saccharibacteria bacterium]
MKTGDTRIGYAPEEIAAAIMGGDLKEINDMLDGFGLRKGFPVFTSQSFKAAAALLNFASVFAGRSQLKHEVANILVDNISDNVNIFLFLTTFLYFVRHDERDGDPHPPEELISIIKEDGPDDEFSGRVAILEENQFLALCEYILQQNTLPRAFSTPLVRYVYTHQFMPSTLLFAYMAGSLRESDFNTIMASDIIGQILDGLSEEFEKEE